MCSFCHFLPIRRRFCWRTFPFTLMKSNYFLPGADITDYFNYGFTEDTWAAYCNRQHRIRKADTGAIAIHPGASARANMQINPLHSVPSKSSIPTVGAAAPNRLPTVVNRTSIPPPGAPNTSIPPPASGPPPGGDLGPRGDGPQNIPSSSSGSGIAVMTHEKRHQYNKKPMDVDFSMPPPGLPPMGMPPPGVAPPGMPPQNFDDRPPPMGADYHEPFDQPHDDYNYGYEPTMESQWEQPPPANPDAPPGDPTYEDRGERDVWQQGRRQHRSPPPSHSGRDRERGGGGGDRGGGDHRGGGDRERERDRDRDRGERRRKRSRSRSPSGSAMRGDPRDSGRYSGRDRDRERERERERGESRGSSRNKERSRSRSPGGHSRHKKSKKDRKEIKQEIKQERPDD
jgi:pre-mRNA 3'-end-processing factor FIP1